MVIDFLIWLLKVVILLGTIVTVSSIFAGISSAIYTTLKGQKNG